MKPQARFHVCRSCRAIMSANEVPFCSVDCGFLWAIIYGTPDLFVASEPPDANEVRNWRTRERAAIEVEVRP